MSKKKELPTIMESNKDKFEDKVSTSKDKIISEDEVILDDLIGRIENIKIRESGGEERRRTKLIDATGVGGEEQKIVEEEPELKSLENLLIDETFFSNVPISDSEESNNGKSVAAEEDDYVDPPCNIYPGWHWNSNKLEFCLKSNSGRIRRKMYVSPKVYGNLSDHPHQYDGVRWMWNRFRRSEGGILADEMGLGKTVQVCVFIGALYRSEIAAFMLIVLPASLISQWKEELDKWCPKIPKFVYHGASNVREEELDRFYLSKRGGILITTFETFRNDIQKLSGVSLRRAQCGYLRNQLGVKVTREDYLREASRSTKHDMELKVPWDVVVIDEAHKLKNSKTKLFKDMQALESYCNILCTGTPFQNRLTELWSLMQCVKPNLLGKSIKAFNHNFVRHISKLSSRNVLESERRASQQSIDRLKCIIKPFILRRTKQTISEAKKDEASGSAALGQSSCDISAVQKYDIVLWHNLSKDQSESYTEVLDSHMVSKIMHSYSISQASKQKNGAGVLEVIIYLLKICKHPLLLLRPEFQTWRVLLGKEGQDGSESHQRGREEEEGRLEFEGILSKEEIGEASHPDFMFKSASKLSQLSVELLREQSTKLQILSILIPRILESPDNKILVFSESIFMLDMVELTVLAPNKVEWERLEGKQSLEERSSSIRSFNKNEVSEVAGQALSFFFPLGVPFTSFRKRGYCYFQSTLGPLV